MTAIADVAPQAQLEADLFARGFTLSASAEHDCAKAGVKLFINGSTGALLRVDDLATQV